LHSTDDSSRSRRRCIRSTVVSPKRPDPDVELSVSAIPSGGQSRSAHPLRQSYKSLISWEEYTSPPLMARGWVFQIVRISGNERDARNGMSMLCSMCSTAFTL
jgi:hypothetical protein